MRIASKPSSAANGRVPIASNGSGSATASASWATGSTGGAWSTTSTMPSPSSRATGRRPRRRRGPWWWCWPIPGGASSSAPGATRRWSTRRRSSPTVSRAPSPVRARRTSARARSRSMAGRASPSSSWTRSARTVTSRRTSVETRRCSAVAAATAWAGRRRWSASTWRRSATTSPWRSRTWRRDEDAAAAERGRVDPDAHVRGPQQRRLVDLGDEHGAPGGDQRGKGGHAAPHAGAAVGDGAEEPAEHDALGDVGVLRRQAEPEPRDVEPVGHGGHEHGEPALGEEDAADGERRQQHERAARAVLDREHERLAGRERGDDGGEEHGRRPPGRAQAGRRKARHDRGTVRARGRVVVSLSVDRGQSSSASPGASTRTSVSGASSAARSA